MTTPPPTASDSMGSLCERTGPWRCFHCDEEFTSERCARDHFGRNEDSETACRIKAGAEGSLVRALRLAEEAADDAIQAMHSESTDAAKAYHDQRCRHNQALIAAEELGYERGLADGRSETPKASTLDADPMRELQRLGQEFDAGDMREATRLANSALTLTTPDHQIETVSVGGLKNLARQFLALASPNASRGEWQVWDGDAATIPSAKGWVQFIGETREHALSREVSQIDWWPWYGEDEKPCVASYLIAQPDASGGGNDGLREALEPVWHWYNSDEHDDRPLLDVVADVVADLQQDRATVLSQPNASNGVSEGWRDISTEPGDGGYLVGGPGWMGYAKEGERGDGWEGNPTHWMPVKPPLTDQKAGS